MKYLFFLIISCYILTASAQPAALKVKTFVTKFKIKNAGIPVNGNFKTGTATIMYDEKNPSNSKFTGIVQSNSINTGIDLRNKHLIEKEEFFNSIKFPTIKMESTKIDNNNGLLNVTFKVTIKEVTKYITIPVSVIKNKDGAMQFATVFKINRRDWGIGTKSITMSDIVEINLSVITQK